MWVPQYKEEYSRKGVSRGLGEGAAEGSEPKRPVRPSLAMDGTDYGLR